ncbi:RNA-binding motif protein, X-linked 2, variant 2 [Schistosoma haematobium]|uniref:RNA-binding motif protein, X-linked 2, variant 2 n=1 Tax=Schistosoma haematobium TaxID=6185 RepID=A0A922S1F1_SCHHA|nr:RNA-binding motif protein, X-linked 2, variant 2 [Schistosoma haematobium]KAH9589612.1 RNA-binding motif protein, X-linked 2, variant 2 [Schistosoma haematobium]CAH8641233.1 unnamed protein product [Schistosoma haematobium]
MNPITNAKNQNLMNEKELSLGHTGTVSSWHRQYKDSAWIYVGGLHYDLTEGDVICVFSQYGEIVNINLVRDKKTGVSKGFAFVCYEDQRRGRIIRVDHVEKYRVPKDGVLDVGHMDKKPEHKRPTDSVSEFVKEHGCGPEVMKQLKKIQQEQDEAEKRRLEAIQKRNGREKRHNPESRSRENGESRHRENREPRLRENREPHSETKREDTSQRNSPRRLRNPSPSPPRKVSIKAEPPSPPRPFR